MRPYSGSRLRRVAGRVETSTRSQPRAFELAREDDRLVGGDPAAASSIQSVAETRTDIGFDAGQAARIAANTSSGQRIRLASEPP